MARWLRENDVDETIYFERYGTARISHYGIRYRRIPCRPVSGVVAMHIVQKKRPQHEIGTCYDWLDAYEPVARLGHTIYVYRIELPKKPTR